MQDDESVAMGLIVHGGNARSDALQAISKARAGDFEAADALLAHGARELAVAHDIQTDQLSAEAREPGATEMTLLMAHAQDHLMNAMTVHDLATQMVELCRQLVGGQTQGKGRR
ncbi:PTS system cellobiose-specific IIA component [Olsenella profusa DSM 13989]|uniref:Putative lichenan-specific phosphotransferase enzyme IIA component n=1 Tax=Olsenella profusa F0195 TaxID=1125712 RepID=U2TX36_9ACTN|nr:PTS lactose/cellobiose transporter subunit IIA [Olsenella profusa]ERL10603.1 putative lichenan-specific phosphotransferase enzyme IIA component [Olsenella profusa F0195]MDP9859494.1 PTS system cellobiose-specific IIA component [Olsenella profusa DSM 13989]